MVVLARETVGSAQDIFHQVPFYDGMCQKIVNTPHKNDKKNKKNILEERLRININFTNFCQYGIWWKVCRAQRVYRLNLLELLRNAFLASENEALRMAIATILFTSLYCLPFILCILPPAISFLVPKFNARGLLRIYPLSPKLGAARFPPITILAEKCKISVNDENFFIN
jgi:hypothetical protein